MKKNVIFIVALFAAFVFVSGCLLWWGYTCPDYWDNPGFVAPMCKVVGFAGLIGFSYMCGKSVSEEILMSEEDE